jgi:hypothetical protein
LSDLSEIWVCPICPKFEFVRFVRNLSLSDLSEIWVCPFCPKFEFVRFVRNLRPFRCLNMNGFESAFLIEGHCRKVSRFKYPFKINWRKFVPEFFVWLFLFQFSWTYNFLKYTQWQCIVSIWLQHCNVYLKAFKPYTLAGTRDLLFRRRTQWPLCHAARAFGSFFSILSERVFTFCSKEFLLFVRKSVYFCSKEFLLLFERVFYFCSKEFLIFVRKSF